MSAVQSPLFEPVLWQGAGFKILDEIQVPEKIEYLEIRDVGQALDAVRDMKTRAFGQVLTFLYSGALLAQGHANTDAAELRRCLAEMTQQFCSARPTFDFHGLGSFFEEWFDDLPSGSDPRQSIANRARELGQRIVRGRVARAKLAASILPNPARVLTHCNVSGELVAVAQYCKGLGKEMSVIATETRPYLQGTRLTAWELAQARVSVAVIPDCAVAQIMEQGEVNVVVVGADRSAQNGDIINKVGTYPLALMAKEYGVPFYALVQDPRSLASGDAVQIEERPGAELLTFQGQSLIASSPVDLSARYPAFDMTPAALITHLIGFDDIYTPETFRQKYQMQQTRRMRRPEPARRYVLVYGLPPKNQYPVLTSALKAERAESVLVPEMRPQLWGAQVLAPELLESNIPATLISDNMMGTLFAQGEIRGLWVFYDSLTDQGARVICGSLLAVRLARLHNVPVAFFTGTQQRGVTKDADVSTFLGRNICPRGVAIRAVGAEMIPRSLLEPTSS
jgi:methylthioribose-1-phosphate isomerase